MREHLGGEPRWDLLLLGLGPDAHCASLFPGKPEVEERSRLVTGVELAGMEPQVPRISLTLPALNCGRGRPSSWSPARTRRGAVARAFGPTPIRRLPPRSSARGSGSCSSLLDPAAAKELG